jgi:hypothetical protein
VAEGKACGDAEIFDQVSNDSTYNREGQNATQPVVAGAVD